MQINHPYPSVPTRVVFTKGSEFEIGRQHAEQIGADTTRGMVHFYYTFWKRVIAIGPKGWLASRIFKAATKLVDPWLLGKLVRQIPPDFVERLKGIAQVTGRPLHELTTAMVLPDMLPYLEALNTRIRPGAFLEVIPPPRFGCSSFIAKGEHFLYGRNLDFPGVAYWDRYPVIQVTEPTNKLRYIGFTTAGAPLAGISGVNEAQISIALHQHYCRESSLKGHLPFIIGEKVLAEARTLDDALRILRDSKVATSWAFVVSDGKTRDGFIYECHPKAAGIRWLGDNDNVLAHSNFYQSPECQPSEFATTGRMNWDNYWRKARLEELVRGTQGKMTPAQAVQFISDHYDSYWGEEKSFNRTVSQVYNIQSYVLDPEKMVVYFAEGDSPIHLHEYAEFDLNELFAGRSGRTGLRLPAYQFKAAKKRDAKQNYILSFISAFDGDYEKSCELMLKCLDDDFTPEAAQIAGVLCLRLNHYEMGRDLLAKGKAFIEEKARKFNRTKMPPEYFEICVFLARAYDLMGLRSEALKIYGETAANRDIEDKHIRKIASEAKVYTRAKLERLLTPFSAYIPFE